MGVSSSSTTSTSSTSSSSSPGAWSFEGYTSPLACRPLGGHLVLTAAQVAGPIRPVHVGGADDHAVGQRALGGEGADGQVGIGLLRGGLPRYNGNGPRRGIGRQVPAGGVGLGRGHCRGRAVVTCRLRGATCMRAAMENTSVRSSYRRGGAASVCLCTYCTVLYSTRTL